MRKIEPLSTLVDDVAPKIALDPPAKNAAPVNSVVPRNVRRVTPAFSIESEDFSGMCIQRTSIEIDVNGMTQGDETVDFELTDVSRAKIANRIFVLPPSYSRGR